MFSTSNRPSNTRNAFTIAALAGAVLAGAAFAQDAKNAPTLSGSLDQPLNQQESMGFSQLSITQVENGKSYALTMNGDKVSAEIDGKKVPQDHIRRHNDRVEILGDDGSVEHTFRIGGLGRSWRAQRMAPAARAPRAPEAPGAPTPPEAPRMKPPPVMIGITMSNVDGGGIRVDSVIDDLPAAKAGIQEGDVIVKIDGKDAKERGDLRAALDSKKAGDKLTCVIKRDGEEKTVTLDLQGFDAEKLHTEGSAPWVTMTDNDHDRWSKEATEALAKALQQLKEADAFKPERLKMEIQKELEKAQKALEEAQASAGGQIHNWLNMQGLRPFVQGDGGGMVFTPDDQGGQVFTVPAMPNTRRMNDLQSRLDRLDKLLDRLEQRMDALEKKP